MNHSDSNYIQRCLQLAELAKGKTYPNPMVGAVIVYNDEIIGEGYHKKAGTPHAEVNAIASVQNKELLKESTIYVSLEPCAHYGKTPPCAEKIIEVGFKKVVIGAMDSHDAVNGKGKAMIERAGIEAVNGILEKQSRAVNKRFFTYHEKKRPFVVLKWAESSDGFMDKDFKPYKISNDTVNQWVHQLRADEHAILVGTTTALVDNPSLTVRHVKGENPVRVVLDLNLKLPKESALLDNSVETIVINNTINDTQENTKFRTLNNQNTIEGILDILYKEQIQSVIVEGGAKLLQQFIDLDLWDEAFVIKNPELTLLNGTKAPQFPSSTLPIKVENIVDNTITTYKNHTF